MKIASAFFVIVTCILSFSAAYGESPLSECETSLMSEPVCVNKINASSYCQNMGDSQEVAQMALHCLERMSHGTRPDKNAVALCLAGFVISSKVEDNRSLCN